jgi:hypothetical protein
MKKPTSPTSTDVGTAPAFPSSEHVPSPGTIGAKPATVVSHGLIGDVATAVTDLSEVTPNPSEDENEDE